MPTPSRAAASPPRAVTGARVGQIHSAVRRACQPRTTSAVVFDELCEAVVLRGGDGGSAGSAHPPGVLRGRISILRVSLTDGADEPGSPAALLRSGAAEDAAPSKLRLCLQLSRCPTWGDGPEWEAAVAADGDGGMRERCFDLSPYLAACTSSGAVRMHRRAAAAASSAADAADAPFVFPVHVGTRRADAVVLLRRSRSMKTLLGYVAEGRGIAEALEGAGGTFGERAGPIHLRRYLDCRHPTLDSAARQRLLEVVGQKERQGGAPSGSPSLSASPSESSVVDDDDDDDDSGLSSTSLSTSDEASFSSSSTAAAAAAAAAASLLPPPSLADLRVRRVSTRRERGRRRRRRRLRSSAATADTRREVWEEDYLLSHLTRQEELAALRSPKPERRSGSRRRRRRVADPEAEEAEAAARAAAGRERVRLLEEEEGVLCRPAANGERSLRLRRKPLGLRARAALLLDEEASARARLAVEGEAAERTRLGAEASAGQAVAAGHDEERRLMEAAFEWKLEAALREAEEAAARGRAASKAESRLTVAQETVAGSFVVVTAAETLDRSALVEEHALSCPLWRECVDVGVDVDVGVGVGVGVGVAAAWLAEAEALARAAVGATEARVFAVLAGRSGGGGVEGVEGCFARAAAEAVRRAQDDLLFDEAVVRRTAAAEEVTQRVAILEAVVLGKAYPLEEEGEDGVTGDEDDFGSEDGEEESEGAVPSLVVAAHPASDGILKTQRQQSPLRLTSPVPVSEAHQQAQLQPPTPLTFHAYGERVYVSHEYLLALMKCPPDTDTAPLSLCFSPSPSGPTSPSSSLADVSSSSSSTLLRLVDSSSSSEGEAEAAPAAVAHRNEGTQALLPAPEEEEDRRCYSTTSSSEDMILVDSSSSSEGESAAAATPPPQPPSQESPCRHCAGTPGGTPASSPLRNGVVVGGDAEGKATPPRPALMSPPPPRTLLPTPVWGRASTGTDAVAYQGEDTMAAYEEECGLAVTLANAARQSALRRRRAEAAAFGRAAGEWCGGVAAASRREAVRARRAFEAMFAQLIAGYITGVEGRRRRHSSGTAAAATAATAAAVSDRLLDARGAAAALEERRVAQACAEAAVSRVRRGEGGLLAVARAPRPAWDRVRLTAGRAESAGAAKEAAVCLRIAEAAAQAAEAERRMEAAGVRRLAALGAREEALLDDARGLREEAAAVRAAELAALEEAAPLRAARAASLEAWGGVEVERARVAAERRRLELAAEAAEARLAATKAELRAVRAPPAQVCVGLCRPDRNGELSLLQHLLTVAEVEAVRRTCVEHEWEQGMLRLVHACGGPARRRCPDRVASTVSARAQATAAALAECAALAAAQRGALREEGRGLARQCAAFFPGHALRAAEQEEADGRLALTQAAHAEGACVLEYYVEHIAPGLWGW